MFRPKLLILEGPDGCGKSTIYQAFRRATRYQVLVIDRWIGSQIAYDRVWGRENVPYMDEWLSVERAQSLVFDCYLAVLTAEDGVLEGRIRAKETGRDLEVALESYREARDWYKLYWEKSSISRKIILDTGLNNVGTCIGLLCDLVSKPIIWKTSEWGQNG